VLEVKTIKGCCPLDCQDSCSWVAHVENDRVVRVEGAKDHPFTRGTLCAKVNDYQERTYAPDRLLHPLRRTGTKGTGQFEQISWAEALDIIASRFTEIIKAYGPEALMPLNYLGSLGVVQRRALMRLFHALGATRFHGSICGAAGNVLQAEGHPIGFDPEEIMHSRFVLLWGANILTASPHHWHFIREAKRRHAARVVCIDPRRTLTSRSCDEHLSIRPGSDTVLAAGMAHVMIEEGLADFEFARELGGDFDEFCEQVKPWTVGRVAAVCGIDATDVVRIAREYGTARPAVIRGGIAPQQNIHGEAFVRSLSALAILGGHWRLPGGGLFIEASPIIHEQRAARPDLMTRESRSLDLARFGDHLTDAKLDPPIKAVMIWGTNPAVVQPDAGKVRQGLSREDLFTVVLEHFMTDTARYADIVLPSSTQLEHFDLQGAWGHHYISVNNKAISPLGEAKSHGEVMRLLSQRLGLTAPALRESDEQIAASALPEEIDLETLKAKGWYKSSPEHRTFGAGPGKIQLAGGVPMPTVAPAQGMLQLLTPKSHFFLNSTFSNMPRQRQAMKRPTLDMNTADAQQRELTDGQQVMVKNTQGAIVAWVHVTDDIHRGVVSLPGKWWSVPQETGAVVNLLTPSSWSPGGQPAYNDTFVEVVKAPEVD
jgi:anaerobic selenocysteine-containing dehydrogenase